MFLSLLADDNNYENEEEEPLDEEEEPLPVDDGFAVCHTVISGGLV